MSIARNNQINILLVEDSMAHAELIFRAFRLLWGRMDIAHAQSIAEAVKLIADNKPDIIITDFMLPDGRGTSLLPEAGKIADTPIILMTSEGDENLAAEAIKAGAVDYVVKSPATFSDMPRVVGRALREWNLIIARRNLEAKMAEIKSAYDKLPEILRRHVDNNTARKILDDLKQI